MKQVNWEKVIKGNSKYSREFFDMPLEEAKELGYVFEYPYINSEVYLFLGAPINQLDNLSKHFFNDSTCPIPTSMKDDLSKFYFCESQECMFEVDDFNGFHQYIEENYPNIRFVDKIN